MASISLFITFYGHEFETTIACIKPHPYPLYVVLLYYSATGDKVHICMRLMMYKEGYLYMGGLSASPLLGATRL